mgnify:FL=1
MPDHAHWLISLGPASSLSGFVGALKRESARAVREAACTEIGRPLWMSSFHDRALRDTDDVLAVARYIVANPLRAGLVKRLGDYPFWNALWV